MTKPSVAALLAGIMLMANAGCVPLFGNLRRDLDDRDVYGEAADAPTTGGKWAEKGFLDGDAPMPPSYYGDRYGTPGHSDRNPASDGASRGRGPIGQSWAGGNGTENAERDSARSFDRPAGDGALAENSEAEGAAARRAFKNGARATRSDFIDESPNEGSLWGSNGQTNYYFTKNKVRGVGDIISLTMEDELVRDVGLEARRALTGRERDTELAAAQDALKSKYLAAAYGTAPGSQDQVATSAAAPNRAPAAAPSDKPEAAAALPPVRGPSLSVKGPDGRDVAVPLATANDIDMAKSLGVKSGETMMGEIVERYSNGNYKIRATKKIPYRNGPPRLVTLVGVVRGSDIAEENDAISSGKLYEYRVEASR